MGSIPKAAFPSTVRSNRGTSDEARPHDRQNSILRRGAFARANAVNTEVPPMLLGAGALIPPNLAEARKRFPSSTGRAA